MTNLQLFETVLWTIIFVRAVKAYILPHTKSRKVFADEFKGKSRLYCITFIALWDITVAGIFFLIALWGKRVITFF